MLAKIKAWIVRRLVRSAGGQAPRLAVKPAGLRVRRGHDERLVAWDAVRKVVAFTRSGGIGDALCLGLEVAGGEVLELTESAPDWQHVTEELAAHVPLAMSPSEWQARLLAEPSVPVVLYEGQAAGTAGGDA